MNNDIKIEKLVASVEALTLQIATEAVEASQETGEDICIYALIILDPVMCEAREASHEDNLGCLEPSTEPVLRIDTEWFPSLNPVTLPDSETTRWFVEDALRQARAVQEAEGLS